MNVYEGRIAAALEIIERYGMTDGAHHKQWVIDQVVRKLLAHKYDKWAEDMCDGDDGPQTYSWDKGMAP